MDFLDILKYPPSLLFVLATLGPVFLVFPLLARLPSRIAEVCCAYGAVPLIAYIAHIYVVHALSILARLLTGQSLSGEFNVISNSIFTPEVFTDPGIDLWAVYVAWTLVLLAIYPLCLWWRGVKRNRQDWWLSYL